MLPSVDEWRSRSRPSRAARTPQDFTPILAARQAAVEAEKLTSDPLWDKFVTYLSAAREQARAAIEKWQATVCDARTDGPALAYAKCRLHEAKGMLASLEWALELPKALMEAGEQAKQFPLPESNDS